MSRPAVVLLVALALGAGACGGDDEGERTPGGAPPAGTDGSAHLTTSTLPEGCERVEEPAPRDARRLRRPRERLSARRAWTVELRTNCGTIAIRLDTERAPRTAASFAALVRRGFYDRLTFHRVAGDPASGPFVVQGGDPLGSGIGGPGYTVVERPPRDLRYTRGTVAMAKTGAEPAGSSGSQFFIVTAADAGLPPDYALVGRVVGGADVVDRIASVRTGADERPVTPIVIERARLTAAGA